jgi:arabinofuranosyltransferase
MVSMRYARNLARGLGLVWNAGQRVEGFSNPLWTLLMALPHWAGLSDATAPLPILALCCALLVWLALATARLGRAVGLEAWAAGLAACLAVFSFDAIGVAQTGLEAVLMACLFAEGLAGVLQGKRAAPLFCALGLALTRFDGPLFVALLVLQACALTPTWRRSLEIMVPAALAWLSLEAGRLAYYGQWLPNTVVMKGDPWPGRWQSGLEYIYTFFCSRYLGMSLAAILGAALEPRARMLGALVLAVAAYVAWIGGDFMPHMRFLLPALPLLAVLAALGLAWLRARAGLAAGAAGLLAVACFSFAMPCQFPGVLRGEGDHSARRIEAALALRRNAPEGAVVGTAWAGLLPYIWGGPCIDFLGKCDAHIARTPPHPEQRLVGHNKWDYPYALGLQPNYVHVELTGKPETLPYYDRRLLEDPAFLAGCARQVAFSDGDTTVFGCRWGRK